MAVTANYGWPKPATTDYYDIDVYDATLDDIDAQVKANEDGIAGKADTVHAHDADDLPDASTSAQGIVQLSSTIDSTDEDKAATPKAIKLVNDKAIALEAAEAVIVLTGSGPAFTTTEPLPESGQKRTLKFPAAATSATVAFTTGGAKNVYAYGTTAFKPKANQVVEVVYDGTNFTVCSAGGGIELPSTIAAGDTPVKLIYSAYQMNNTTYANVPGHAFTAVKAGTYRIAYDAHSGANTAYRAKVKIRKNGVDVSGSELIASYGTAQIDVALAAGDVITKQIAMESSSSTQARTSFLAAAIVAADLQSALNALIS